MRAVPLLIIMNL